MASELSDVELRVLVNTLVDERLAPLRDEALRRRLATEGGGPMVGLVDYLRGGIDRMVEMGRAGVPMPMVEIDEHGLPVRVHRPHVFKPGDVVMPVSTRPANATASPVWTDGMDELARLGERGVVKEMFVSHGVVQANVHFRDGIRWSFRPSWLRPADGPLWQVGEYVETSGRVGRVLGHEGPTVVKVRVGDDVVSVAPWELSKAVPTTRFSWGDRVRVMRSPPKQSDWPEWTRDMDQTCGRTGVVVGGTFKNNVFPEHVNVLFEDNVRFAYSPNWLERVR